MMLMRFDFFADKERAVHAGALEDIDGRHPRRLEAHGAAAVRKFDVVGDVKLLTEKAINERAWMLIFFCHLRPANFLNPIRFGRRLVSVLLGEPCINPQTGFPLSRE